MNKHYFLFIPVILLLVACSGTSEKKSKDWLIDNSKYKADVQTSSDGKNLVISNGLVSRTFRLAPNLATIGIREHTSGQNHLRAIRPEGRIEIDGTTLDIGGLLGQPIQNYLLTSWIDSLAVDPNSFQYKSNTVQAIQKRFEWKKRPEWMAVDAPWPPAGIELTLRFEAPEYNLSEAPRQTLYRDDFRKLDAGWKVEKSSSHERSSFVNEGKTGEIMTYENASVFAERAVPAGTRVIEGLVSQGTDKSTTWGPGMVLVFPSHNIKFNIRSKEGRFGVYNGNTNEEFMLGQVESGREYYLRMRLEEGLVICEASKDGKEWTKITQIAEKENPKLVRVGKTNRNGSAGDANDKGKLERCHIKVFAMLGDPILNETKPSQFKGLVANVHYEIYDGIPLISKWITIENNTGRNIVLNRFTSEIIAAVEGSTNVEIKDGWAAPNFYVETDYAFANSMFNGEKAHSVHWVRDSTYTTQISYMLNTPCLLEVRPPAGPEQTIPNGQTFSTFRTWELFFDSFDKERKALAKRKMYRTIAPWVTESPIMMHVRHGDPEAVKLAIDQCAETGFEMVIMTFGSGFNMESGDPAYYAKMKELADYAHGKKVALGGYSLLASRSVSEEDDVINPATGKRGGIARFGESPCLESKWGQEYFRKITELYETAGLDIIEHDGSYPGDFCGSTKHPGHKGYLDSQWNQWRKIADFYQWCRSKGIFLNVPDWYFLNGSNKAPMGYRETNWSLPRAQQEIIERQNIYDGTWDFTPSMGWMFVPLTEYHGGGAAATIEPLNEHLEHYNQRLVNLFGAGVQACYRGPRLYDTDSTKAVVKHWVNFYKKYRPILDSDVIHLRRADGQNWDGLLHVNPSLKQKGLLMVYNPLNEPIKRVVNVPLYYTGLTKKAVVKEQDKESKTYTLERDYHIRMNIEIPAKGYNWYVIE